MEKRQRRVLWASGLSLVLPGAHRVLLWGLRAHAHVTAQEGPRSLSCDNDGSLLGLLFLTQSHVQS